MIDMMAQRIDYYDSLCPRRLSPAGSAIGKVLLRYLKDEYATKKKGTMDVTRWETAIPPDVPRQTNNFDCGLFVLANAEAVGRVNGSPCLQHADMPNFRKFVCWVLMEQEAREEAARQSKRKAKKPATGEASQDDDGSFFVMVDDSNGGPPAAAAEGGGGLSLIHI